jgi:UDP-N-acetylglucosamine 2-epimerase (non-hydrolysing)
MSLVDLIAGARPNFMKIAPMIDAFRAGAARGGSVQFRLIHTGQHYDRAMSGEFFDQLGIPEPDVNLGVGSGTQAEQTAAIMIGYERVVALTRPDVCVVVGDVTSTMACAIVARKMGVPVAHVEGGIRSHDWTMPEEINRVATDSVTNWFFTTSETAGQNLRRAGVTDGQIFFVGNTMIDTLLAQRPFLTPPPLWSTIGLEAGRYFVVTLHRPANVDGSHQLSALLDAIAANTGGLPVIFPVHPRTAATLRGLQGRLPTLHYVAPLGYREFNYLVQNSMAVITDSGGVTEETTVMGVPCLTLRDNTERPETVAIGTNELVGTNPANLAPALARVLSGKWKKGAIPEKWDGRAGERIVSILERLLA